MLSSTRTRPVQSKAQKTHSTAPERRLAEILLHARAVVVHDAKIRHSFGVALRGCPAVPLRRCAKVLLHAAARGVKDTEARLGARRPLLSGLPIPAFQKTEVYIAVKTFGPDTYGVRRLCGGCGRVRVFSRGALTT